MYNNKTQSEKEPKMSEVLKDVTLFVMQAGGLYIALYLMAEAIQFLQTKERKQNVGLRKDPEACPSSKT